MLWLTSLNDGLNVLDVRTGAILKVYDKPCFGITEGEERTYLFTIDNMDDRMCPEPKGKIISFIYDSIAKSLQNLVIEVEGIDNGTHQLLIHDKILYIQETYRQTIKTYKVDMEGHIISTSCACFYPFGKDVFNYHYISKSMTYEIEQHKQYRHMNALLMHKNGMYVLSPFLGRQSACERQHPCISLLTKDMHVSGCDILLPTVSVPHDLVAIGNEIMYVNSDFEIIHLGMNNWEVTKTIPFEPDGERKKWMRGLCFYDNKYIVGCGKTIQVISLQGKHESKFHIDGFTCVIQCVKPRNLYPWEPFRKATHLSPHIIVPFSLSTYRNLDLLHAFRNDVLDFETFLIDLNKTTNIGIKSAGTGIKHFCMTTAHHTYNLFTWKGNAFIEELRKQILHESKAVWKYMQEKNMSNEPFPSKVFGKCWANVLHNTDDQLKRHVHKVHEHSFLTGHFTIQHNESKTIYEYPFYDHITQEFPNEVGRMVIFPSYVYHWTTPHNNDLNLPRITLGFDLLLEQGMRCDQYADMYVDIS